MVYKPILRTAVGVQSLGVLGQSMKALPRKLDYGVKKRSKPVKRQTKRFVRAAVGTMVGTALLVPTAKIVSDL